MIKKLIQSSMDLYSIKSGATLPTGSDHLIINFGGKRQIILWVTDDVLLPEIIHDFEESKMVEFRIVKKVAELTEKYEEDNE